MKTKKLVYYSDIINGLIVVWESQYQGDWIVNCDGYALTFERDYELMTFLMDNKFKFIGEL